MALAYSAANINPAGLVSWAINDATRPDDAYYSLPSPREFDFSVSSINSKDSYGRPSNYAWDLKMSCKCSVPRTQANFIDLLASIGVARRWYHRLLFIDGKVVGSGASSTPVVDVGIKWKLVSDADLDKDWYLEVNANRKLLNTEYTALLTTASQPAVGTPGAADTLYPARLIASTDYSPAGISSIVLSGTDTLGALSGGKFMAELMTYPDSRGVEFGHLIKIDIECDVLQTSQAELLQWDNLALAQNGIVVTFLNGAVFTAPTNTGMSYSFVNSGDAVDGRQVVKFVASGVVLPSGWAALWS